MTNFWTATPIQTRGRSQMWWLCSENLNKNPVILIQLVMYHSKLNMSSLCLHQPRYQDWRKNPFCLGRQHCPRLYKHQNSPNNPNSSLSCRGPVQQRFCSILKFKRLTLTCRSLTKRAEMWGHLALKRQSRTWLSDDICSSSMCKRCRSLPKCLNLCSWFHRATN